MFTPDTLTMLKHVATLLALVSVALAQSPVRLAFALMEHFSNILIPSRFGVSAAAQAGVCSVYNTFDAFSDI